MNIEAVDYFAINRQGWDRRAELHFGSKFYDVEGFLAGQTSLREIELGELGSVAGCRLLHLQCHFGLDTLSWTRLGARCTGVDLSPVAIDKARQLAQQSGLNAEFVCANVLDFAREQRDPFDIVFTSYGALCWLPDLRRWARVVAENLAPGGRFHMAEFHPIYDLLSGYAYFTGDRPDVYEEASYAEPDSDQVAKFAVWCHPISSVVSALIEVGIQIEGMAEYPFSPYNCFKDMQEREPGRFFLQHQGQDIPLVYSIRGRKVA